MLTNEQRLDYIRQIEWLPSALEQLVANLADEQLDTPYGDGKWSVRQVVHHLADSHINGLIRFKKLLTEERPTLATYEQDEFARLPDMTLPLKPSFDILYGLHQRWTAMLEGLDDQAWSKTAWHPEDGEQTLDSLLQVYAEHGVKHIEHIQGLLDRQGWR